MKKFLLPIFAMFFAIILFASCDGKDGEPGSLNAHIEYVTIKAGQWDAYDDDGKGTNLHYYYEHTISNVLTNREKDYIYDSGSIHGFMYLDPGTNVEALVPLPYVVPIEEIDRNSYLTWIEIISYEYQPGNITFTLRLSDFAELETGQLPPELNFRMVLYW